MVLSQVRTRVVGPRSLTPGMTNQVGVEDPVDEVRCGFRSRQDVKTRRFGKEPDKSARPYGRG